MATSDRALDRARRFAEADRLRAGRELRTARTAAGLSLRVVSAACGISVSQLSRIERGRSPGVALEQLAVIGAVVGLDVRVRTYPGGDALRDAGQARLMNRFGAILPPIVWLSSERPLAIVGDQRAWDGSIGGLDGMGRYPSHLRVEAETRIHDFQAQARRIALEARDAGEKYVLVVVADTRLNRDAIRAAGSALLADFPIPPRVALAALRAGRHPGGSAIVFV